MADHGRVDYLYEQFNPLGPTVRVILTRFDGDQVVERHPALLAALLLGGDDERLGVEFRSARLALGDYLDVWGRSA